MIFKPGDLARVIPHPSMEAFELSIVGLTVIILGDWRAPEYWHPRKKFPPYYTASGLPPDVHAISHAALELIPPPAMDIEEEVRETIGDLCT